MEALLTEATVERMYIVVGIGAFLMTMIMGGIHWHRNRIEVFCGGKDALALVLAVAAPLAVWYIFQDADSTQLRYACWGIAGLFLGISLLLTLFYNIATGKGVLMALFAVLFKACLLASVIFLLILLLARCSNKK